MRGLSPACLVDAGSCRGGTMVTGEFSGHASGGVRGGRIVGALRATSHTAFGPGRPTSKQSGNGDRAAASSDRDDGRSFRAPEPIREPAGGRHAITGQAGVGSPLPAGERQRPFRPVADALPRRAIPRELGARGLRRPVGRGTRCAGKLPARPVRRRPVARHHTVAVGPISQTRAPRLAAAEPVSPPIGTPPPKMNVSAAPQNRRSVWPTGGAGDDHTTLATLTTRTSQHVLDP